MTNVKLQQPSRYNMCSKWNKHTVVENRLTESMLELAPTDPSIVYSTAKTLYNSKTGTTTKQKKCIKKTQLESIVATDYYKHQD